MGRKIFRRTSPSFEVRLVVPSHPRRGGLGASINGAAGIRCCYLRCPESVGIIRVASGDGEQETIAEFFPQIQDSTANDASSRLGGRGCRSWHGLSSPWSGILEAIG